MLTILHESSSLVYRYACNCSYQLALFNHVYGGLINWCALNHQLMCTFLKIILMKQQQSLNCAIILIVIFHIRNVRADEHRVRRSQCETNINITNGYFKLTSGNSIMQFKCNNTYMLYGAEKIACFWKTWSDKPPICIKNSCVIPNSSEVLRIATEYQGAILKLSCAVNYRLVGPVMIICDGKNWSDKIPFCEEGAAPTACNFEDADLCGWMQHDKDDQEWHRNSGPTETTRTGPQHDHTFGKDGTGHYMFFESSSPTRIGHKAILLSPKYTAAMSNNTCFNFWYHIMGEGDIGDLELFIMPETENNTAKLKPVFLVSENKGEEWQEQSVQIAQQFVPFQILFVATRGESYRSDFAIDDVQLENCSDTLLVRTTTKISTTLAHSLPLTRMPFDPFGNNHQSTSISPSTPFSTLQGSSSDKLKLVTNLPFRSTTSRPVANITEQMSKVTQILIAITNQDATTAERASTEPKEIQTSLVSPNILYSETKVYEIVEKIGSSKIGYFFVGIVVAVATMAVVIAGLVIYRRTHRLRPARQSNSWINPLYKMLTDTNT